MFNSSKKTIGVFVNRPELNFQKKVCTSLSYYAKKQDYNISFMTSYGIREMVNQYEFFESDIVDFSPIEDFDAIIVVLDTFDTLDFRSRIINALKNRASGPVISYREENENFYSVISSANNAVYTIVDHLIKVHNIKDIRFMAGYENHYDSQARLEKYYDAMNKNGVDIPENAVFYGDMWKNKAEEAYEFYFCNSKKKPEAIVCANDFMARSLCDVLISHGIDIPKDVVVTGFDNAPEATEYEPRLTTVEIDYDLFSKKSIEMISDYFAGKELDKITEIDAIVRYRESCGCVSEIMTDTICSTEFFRRSTELEQKYTDNMFFLVDMSECSTLQDIKEVVGADLKRYKGYKEFYMCSLVDNIDSVIDLAKKDIKATFEFGFENGKEITENKIIFKQKMLIPDVLEKDDEPKIYYFRLLHNRNRTLGYTVVRLNTENDLLDDLYHEWCLTLSITLSNYLIRKKMNMLIAENKENSVKDFMTSMYNRRGLEEYISYNWNRWIRDKKEILFVSVDLDGLKRINDELGHNEGDFAISCVAKALNLAVADIGVAARMGGDEFFAVVDENGVDRTNFIMSNMRFNVRKIRNEAKKEYEVDFSIGFYRTIIDENISYDECVSKSDGEMYNNKNSKRSKK